MKLPAFFAKRFVAGETADQAIEAVRSLNQDGIRATLDLLGENVESLAQANEAVTTYYALFDKINQANIQSGISIKLTQLGLDFGLQACLERTRKVLDRAKEHDLFVRLDMEGSNYTQQTIDAFLILLKENYRVGIVLQAYLKRSKEDIETMIENGATVRVCKGAYKEPPELALQDMVEIRSHFKDMVHRMFQTQQYVCIATHDDELIDWALAWIEEHHVSRDDFEFQMLYGLRRQKLKSLADQGYRVRAYVPYGTHWFPYFYRRLRERKENILFVLRSLFKDA